MCRGATAEAVEQFTGIPAHVQQEDGSRDVFERVFQAIDTARELREAGGEERRGGSTRAPFSLIRRV